LPMQMAATTCHSQVWEGDGVVKSARKLIGATNPLEAEAGTIRGDLAIQTGRNVVHGSDSPENGVREASKCFSPLLQYGIQLPLQAMYVAPPVIHGTRNKRCCAAAELWFGGDDDMVTWEPSLKPWLVE